MNRSLLLWVIALGCVGPSLADNVALGYGPHLLEAADQPIRLRIASEETSIRLRVFIDSSASPILHFATWQASGQLGMPIEQGTILVPAAINGSVEREITVPIPYAGAEKPLQFRVVVEAITQQDNQPKRLVILDILRRDPTELPTTIAAIKESGIPLEANNKSIRKTLGLHQINCSPPQSCQAREPKLVIEDAAPLFDSKASSDIAFLQKIQTSILQMQNRKSTP